MDDEIRGAVATVWAAAASLSSSEVLRRIDALVSESPRDAQSVFEAASARDYADREAEAEQLYRRALDLGLTEPHRGRAVVQLASTLRNLGRPQDGITLLQDYFGAHPEHPLTDAARAFLALCLVDAGDPRGAAAVALDALADHLPEYQRSVRAYAAALASDS